MTTLQRGHGLTIDDIESMPDDGNRYELIDGVLLVSPSPATRHQRAVYNLWQLLNAAAPDDIWAMGAPFDVILGRRTWVVPDVLVAPKADYDDKRLPVPPLLAVEVLSPSNAITDLNVKFDRYRRAAIPSYWVVDPREPRLIVWELRGEDYVEVADVGAEETWTATRPYPVTITPARLVE
ncbi:Uma2 family endonuclease [Nocardioides stalactiti]|uniref:Uma2 family endonuclease n=1 Tax=Nocardioides stalactiti TaxID=2755356 RepID=UPI001FEB9F86|nr:Uma2 family endonuclease [Nocardioides stalactiti]